MSDPSSANSTVPSTGLMAIDRAPQPTGSILKYIMLLSLFAALGYASYYLFQQQQRVQLQLQQLQEAQQQTGVDSTCACKNSSWKWTRYVYNTRRW